MAQTQIMYFFIQWLSMAQVLQPNWKSVYGVMPILFSSFMFSFQIALHLLPLNICTDIPNSVKQTHFATSHSGL